MTAQGFLTGVNYWPRRKAMTWWKEFDYGEVEAELDEIAGLGLGVVRIFLLWEDFQPQPAQIADGALRDLEVTLNAAAAAGLKVIPTFFTGYTSGANWIPTWALGDVQVHRRFPHIVEGQQTPRGIRDIYADPEMLESQLLQLRVVTSCFARHRAIYAWDLANEPARLLQPRTPQQARAWAQLLVDEVRRNDPRHPVTLGLQTEALDHDKHFRLEDLAAAGDFLSVHCRDLSVPWSRGPLDADVAPFLNTLAATLGGKPALCEELGVCTLPEGYTGLLRTPGNVFCANQEEAAAYFKEALQKLQRVGSLGALAWCFSDYDPCLWDQPPLDFAVHERYFGLTTSEGELKPAGAVLRDFAGSRPPLVTPPLTVPLNMTPTEYYRAPAGHIVELYKGFVRRQ